MTAEVTAGRKVRMAAWIAAVLVGLVMAVMPAASPAWADDAQNQAAQQVSTERCAQMRAEKTLPRQYTDDCESRLAADLLSGKAGQSSWLDGLCKWVPDLPLVGNPCQKLLNIMRGVWKQFQDRVNQIRGTVQAITNPVQTAMKNFSQTISDANKTLIQKVMPELIHISSPNIASKGFLSSYAAGAGLAILVLVVMLARLFYKASTNDMTGEELAESLWRWTPTALLAVLFGPGLGYLLISLSDSLSIGIVNYFSGDIGSLVTKMQAMIVLGDGAALPGGPLISTLIMLLALIGLVGLVGGLLVQLLVLYITGVIMAIAFVMMIDPHTRPRALKVPMTWVGLTLVKPLLFFLIGAIARMADSAFTMSSIQDDGLRSLVTAVVAAMALLMLGLAPWSLLKFAPVLPDGSGSRMARSSRSHSSGMGGSLAHSTMMQMSYRRLQGSPGGGGQPGGPPGGASSSDGPGGPSGQARQPQTQRPATAAPAAGDAAAKPAAGTPAAAPASAGTGTASAAGTAGASTAGATAGATAGGTSAGTAAAAGATAGTGGVAAPLLIAAQAADAAKKKAKDAADRAGDAGPGE